MEQKYLLKENFLIRWRAAFKENNSHSDIFTPKIKVVSKKGEYSFGIIHNSYRFKRYFTKKERCPLCNEIINLNKDVNGNLDQEGLLSDYYVIPNKFPIVDGTSLAVTKGIGENERPMYDTKNLDNLAEELNKLINYANIINFRLFHNSEGFGATIPNHEHWHLTNFGKFYSEVGIYGFDTAEIENLPRIKEKIMPNFPFTHLIFDQQDSEKIVYFLKRLDETIGYKYHKQVVPHILCQDYRGNILIAPGKQYREKSRGAGEVAGHFIVETEEDFLNTDYSLCMKELEKLLIKKEELNLTNLL